jgi:hypothetical protein
MEYDCVKLLVFDPNDNDTHVTIARTPRETSAAQFREVLDLIHGQRGSPSTSLRRTSLERAGAFTGSA